MIVFIGDGLTRIEGIVVWLVNQKYLKKQLSHNNCEIKQMAKKIKSTEFIVTKPPTGWTCADSIILEKAMDMAGISSNEERWKAQTLTDEMGIIILAPMVRAIEAYREHIKLYFQNHNII